MTFPAASDGVYRTLREFFAESHFETGPVHERCGIGQDFEYLRLIPGSLAARPSADPLDTLVRFLIAGEFVSLDALPAQAVEAMQAAGLIEQNNGSTFCPVALYPAQGLYIASDRWANPDLSPIRAAEDVVYPAITPQTLEFQAALPSSRCERFLELCSGTAIAALVAAKNYARHAWAFDITERCREFGEFNRRLNGLANVTIGRGDLYQPAGDLTFDRIAAHPPYVPVLEQRKIYSDAGETGEAITRRVFKELGSRLTPGGRLYLMATGIERTGEPYEQRVREWLGGDHDLAVIVRRYQDPSHFALQSTVKNGGGQGMYERWMARFAAWRIHRFAHCLVVVQKPAGERPRFTARREAGPESGVPETEWLLTFESAAANPEFAASLLDARPAASAHAVLDVRHSVAKGRIEAQQFVLRTEYPFSLTAEVDLSMPPLLSVSNGSRTVRQIHQQAQLAAQMSLPDFASLVRTLAAGGFVELDGYRPERRRD